MKSNYSKFLLIIIAFLGGFVLMSMELVFPRISMIWFGNVLSVWAIDLSMSLVIIAIGYRLGSWLLQKNKYPLKACLIAVYFFGAFYLLLINVLYKALMEYIAPLDEVFGSLLFSMILMFPTMGILAFSGPLLVKIFNATSSKHNSGSSLIFGFSTLGGAVAMLIVGLYTLPNLGISITFYFLILLLLLNAFLIIPLKKEMHSR